MPYNPQCCLVPVQRSCADDFREQDSRSLDPLGSVAGRLKVVVAAEARHRSPAVNRCDSHSEVVDEHTFCTRGYLSLIHI